MRIVALKAKNPKGKSKINLWGDTWIVRNEGLFDGEPSLLLESMPNEKFKSDLRWVWIDNDPDFLLGF